jgi:hypothetical protein
MRIATAVVAPTFGGYQDQGAPFGFDVVDGRLDEASSAAAIHSAVRAPRPQPVPAAQRRSNASHWPPAISRSIDVPWRRHGGDDERPRRLSVHRPAPVDRSDEEEV